MTDSEYEEIIQNSSQDDLIADIERFRQVKEQIAELTTELESLQEYLAKAITDPVSYDDVVVTVVRGTVDRWDTAPLESNPVLWERVSKRVIDKAAYIEAARAGLIDRALHQQCYHTVERKPYLKVTVKTSKGKETNR